jgi:two-component system, NtrC family, sensor kinase
MMTWYRHIGIRQKLLLLAAGISVILIVVTGSIQAIFVQRFSEDSMRRLQSAQLLVAKDRISEFLNAIQLQVRESNSLPWKNSAFKIEDRQEELHRVIKLNPAIESIQVVDNVNRETLFVSRSQLDRVSSLIVLPALDSRVLKSVSASGQASHFQTEKAAGDSDAILSIFEEQTIPAASDRIVIRVNLRLVTDLVSQLKFGLTGRTWIVDSQGNLIAHPNLSLVLRGTNVSQIEGISSVIKNDADSNTASIYGLKAVSPEFQGQPIFISVGKIAGPGWLVVVEQSETEVNQPSYEALRRLFFLGLAGTALSLLVSFFLADKLSRPILALERGAKLLGGGDLTVRVRLKTGDEVEQLASQFNQMAQQLQEYTLSLEEKVATKTAELQRSNNELAAASRHKSEFLAHMSHELRTPLNAVIGFSDSLKLQIFGALNPKQVEYVSDIHASGIHLLSLINTILDLAKIESGKVDLDITEVDVKSAVLDSITLVKERSSLAGVKIVASVDALTEQWPLDERKFKQVLVNLLTNAVKWSNQGGIVEINCTFSEDAFRLSVKDTGAGIAEIDIPRLFSEFVQVGNDSKRASEGTGLGLAIVKRLVELHGGQVGVSSRIGEGSIFTLEFPRTPFLKTLE